MLLWGVGINIAAMGMLAVGCLMAGLVVMPFALAAVAWQHVGRASYRRWGPVVGLLLALLAVLFFPAFGQDAPDYQEMAHDATRTLKSSRVWVEVDPKVTTGNYDCNRRLISLGIGRNAPVAPGPRAWPPHPLALRRGVPAGGRRQPAGRPDPPDLGHDRGGRLQDDSQPSGRAPEPL